MAHTLSANKRIRQNKTRQMRNRVIKSRVKTYLKKVEHAMKMDQLQEGLDNYKLFVSALDKAVKKNVFHKNTAARKKSNLIKKLHSMSQKEGA